jgi:hypothetical protein
MVLSQKREGVLALWLWRRERRIHFRCGFWLQRSVTATATMIATAIVPTITMPPPFGGVDAPAVGVDRYVLIDVSVTGVSASDTFWPFADS